MWLVTIILDSVFLVAIGRYSFSLALYFYEPDVQQQKHGAFSVSQAQILLVPLLYIASSYVVAIFIDVGNRGSQTIFQH